MRATISNSTSIVELKFIEVKDNPLAKKVHQKDLGEMTINTLNIETRGIGTLQQKFKHSQIERIKVKVNDRKKQVLLWKKDIVVEF